jgi:hypothetical protein
VSNVPLGNGHYCRTSKRSHQHDESEAKEVSIPQLNAEQVALLESMVNGLGAFSQAVPDPKLDTVNDYHEAMRTMMDNEQLVILGLIKEITEEPATKDKLATIFAMTNRLFRVYELTEIGRKMFDGVKRKIQ